ncbi:Craniofacial development protein 1 [Aspergillus nanangensis]|uniref:SWR1-complex protein 5 n=1 Tax=Aspergillus nanangensis TaxID=2582783 RepID=A0AAD4CJV8_ASPNN|nr:Craniofacial development protein 1 [Aspergillus nanangensis]
MSGDTAPMTSNLDLEGEQYDSAEDEDFQLDDAPDDGDITSEDENDEEPAKKRRKQTKTETAGDIAGLDSGDEVTIQNAKSKKRKQTGKKPKGKGTARDEDEDDDIDFDEDEGGPGGFVRTRAMRMRLGEEERKPLAKIDGATVDVDALWEKMNTPQHPAGTPNSYANKEDGTRKDGGKGDGDVQEQITTASENRPQNNYSAEMVKIKRTYKFAGEMITEEKLVPKDSAEAKIFLASEEGAESLAVTDGENGASAKEMRMFRRPLRKVSRFDPNPTGSIKKSWEKQPIGETAEQEENARGPKINTVEKSRLDWAAYVDQAGIKDELNVHSKAKEGFLGRMDFLDRVGANEDEERRNARLKGRK